MTKPGNTLEERLRALLEKYEDWNSAADIERDLRAAAAIGAELAFEEAASMLHDLECEADWDNHEACPEYIEDCNKCTACLVDHRLRAAAQRAKEKP